jgi:antitoxin component YwqK of YwqJK toxin-antitoxin module
MEQVKNFMKMVNYNLKENFFNGKKWNGIGYNIDGNIEYELKNGRGKIKQFYYNGKLEYEGEYLNGKKHGKGKDYNQNGKLIFEGKYLNGKR